MDTYDLLLVNKSSIVTDISRTISEINGDIGRKKIDHFILAVFQHQKHPVKNGLEFGLLLVRHPTSQSIS